MPLGAMLQPIVGRRSRRRVIAERYAKIIEGLYAEAPQAR